MSSASESIWDFFGVSSDSEVFPGERLIKGTVNKVLAVAVSSTGIIVIAVAGISMAFIAKDKFGSFWKNDTIIGMKRGVILSKWVWEKIDPFIHEIAEKKEAKMLEKFRYGIDQLFDVIDDFLKSRDIISIFKGESIKY